MAHFVQLLMCGGRDPCPVLVNLDQVLSIRKDSPQGSVLTFASEPDISVLETLEWFRKHLPTPRAPKRRKP